MFRGLKFKETEKTEDGKTIVVLRETISNRDIERNNGEIER